jgi:hypothetical protein
LLATLRPAYRNENWLSVRNSLESIRDAAKGMVKEMANPNAHSGKAVTAWILIGTVDIGSTLVPPGASAI